RAARGGARIQIDETVLGRKGGAGWIASQRRVTAGRSHSQTQKSIARPNQGVQFWAKRNHQDRYRHRRRWVGNLPGHAREDRHVQAERYGSRTARGSRCPEARAGKGGDASAASGLCNSASTIKAENRTCIISPATSAADSVQLGIDTRRQTVRLDRRTRPFSG